MSKANRAGAPYQFDQRPNLHRPRDAMPQFVILRHTMSEGSERPSHFDLMLEQEGVLLTWAMDQWGELNVPHTAVELAPHRLDYLTYEGPVSNNRGDVERVAKGPIEWLVHNTDRMELKIDFGQWWGRLVLQRVSGEQWTAVFQDELRDGP